MLRSRAIAERLCELGAFQRARVIAAYVAMRGEADPGPIVEAARAAGKSVVLPRVSWERECLDLCEVGAGDALDESGMGFMQPRADAAAIADDRVDLVIVPALAVDGRGHRVGWGKGFYDRLLASLDWAVSVAIVFDFQLVDEVPDTPGDVPVHRIVTDRQTLQTPSGLARRGTSQG